MKRIEIKELKKISAFNYDNIFDIYKDDDGMYYYNLYNSIQIDDINPAFYTEHIFREGDYWTKLAFNYYRDTALWWIILVVNKIIDPLKLPEPGTKLKIPNTEVVSEIMKSMHWREIL